MASTTLDFPEPFGPTTTVTPGSNSRTVGSANDLKPLREIDLRNTAIVDPSGGPSRADGPRPEPAGPPAGGLWYVARVLAASPLPLGLSPVFVDSVGLVVGVGGAVIVGILR